MFARVNAYVNVYMCMHVYTYTACAHTRVALTSLDAAGRLVTDSSQVSMGNFTRTVFELFAVLLAKFC